MDESGYPIDTTYLDADGDHDDDENLQTQESETIQINPNAHDINGSSVSSDVFTEVKAQEAEEENKNLSDAAEPHKEENEASAAEEEQGGSPSSSSWLGSSVTEWLGSSKAKQSGSLDQLAGEDEGKNIAADSSLASSVTGWLGFGGDRKPDNVEENVKLEEESYTSTVTGWLGFGGETKAVDVENEQNQEQETEPVEKFWSRRMSLLLEGSELQEEEKTEMGAFGWLGSGLSSRLGFGQNKQDVREETKLLIGDADKQQEQEAMGFGGIFGFGNDKTDDNEGDIKDTEKDKSLEAENLDTDESQASFTGEIKTETEESQAEEPTSVPTTEPVSADSSHNIINDNPNRRESSIFDVEDRKEEVSPQAVQMSSSINSFSQTDYNNEIEEAEDKRHDSAGNMVEGEMRESVVDEVIDMSNIKDTVTPSGRSLVPDHGFDEAVSESTERFEGREDDAKEQTPKSVEVTTVDQDVEESDMVVKHDFRGGAQKEEQSDDMTHSSHIEMSTAQTETSAEESQISSDAEESKEENQSPSLKRDDEFIPDEKRLRPLAAETNGSNSTSPAITDDNVETKLNHEELGLEGSSREFGSLHFDNKNLYDDILKEDSKIILTNINQTLGSPQREDGVATTLSDAESLKDPNKETGRETTTVKEDALSEKSTLAPETETEESEISEEVEKTITAEKEESEKDNILIEEEKKQEVNEVKRDELQAGAQDRNEKEKNKVENKENEEEDQQQVEEMKEEVSQENPTRLEGFNEFQEKMEESNKRATLDEDTSSSSFTKTTKHPERQTVEKIREEKHNKVTSENVKDEKIEEGTAEKQHEENDQPEGLNPICPGGGKEEVEETGEDGASSTGVAAAWMAENKTEVSDKSNDVAEEQILKTDGTTFESGPHNDGSAFDSAESQIQTEHEEDPTESSHPAEATESRGTFGLFKDALGLFSQTASTTSTDPAESSDINTHEPSQTQVSEPDPEPTTDPVPTSEHPKNVHPTAPPTTETPTKTSPLTQTYKHLFTHVSPEETAVLSELFGRHKLQFLDYVLGGSEGVTAGDDQSILSDIERLLDHHREVLVAPRTRITDAPQEDKEKTRTLIALQKLEMLLKTIKVTFSTGISDVSKNQGIFLHVTNITADFIDISKPIKPVHLGVIVFCHQCAFTQSPVQM